MATVRYSDQFADDECNRDFTSTENWVRTDLLKHEQPELSLPTPTG